MPYKDSQAQKEAQARNNVRRKAVILEYVNNIKMDRGCYFCGIRNPIVPDFHHIDPSTKDVAISTMISGRKRLKKYKRRLTSVKLYVQTATDLFMQIS